MSCTGMAFFPANFMLQTPPPPPSSSSSPHEDDHLQPSLTPSNINPHDYHGVASFLGKRSMSFSAGLDVCTEEMNNEDELSDDCNSQVGEKKKRLNMEQVKTLEKNFELGNKLEPERKMQLARALGLQPRQIAIWFQNRRARWKTKQLEKDYDILKRQFEALKSDNDVLQNQNKKLQAEIMILKKSRDTEAINLNKLETEGSCSIKSENSSDLNLDISRTAVDSPLSPQAIRPIFPPLRPPSVVQFFHESATTRPDITNHHHHQHQLQHHKFMPASSAGDHDHHNQAAGPEEPFCNMFCSMDEQPSFWPWPDNSPHAFH